MPPYRTAMGAAIATPSTAVAMGLRIKVLKVMLGLSG
jgi:hypothetical protein